jgi:hypothetical protein
LAAEPNASKYAAHDTPVASKNEPTSPSPLYQLLVLATLSSARISADIAVAAARETVRRGVRTPQRMRQASWQ